MVKPERRAPSARAVGAFGIAFAVWVSFSSTAASCAASTDPAPDRNAPIVRDANPELEWAAFALEPDAAFAADSTPALERTGARDPRASIELDELVREVDAVVARLGDRRRGYRTARRLDRLVRERFLRTYDVGADSIASVLHGGRFNCLSGTFVYALAARRAGFRVRVLESPTHVLPILSFGDRSIHVETTDPFGFDIAWREARPLTGAEPPPDGSARSSAETRAVTGLTRFRELDVDEIPGLLWLNAAVRSLERSETEAAVVAVARSAAHLHDLAVRAAEVRPILARAFRIDYERGRFEAAYRAATTERELFGDATSGSDRIAAAALKRIEAAAHADRPAEAWTRFEDAATLLGTEARDRLALRVGPLIAAAAVRTGRWSVAEQAAACYAAVEPDPVEARRLLDWIAERRSAELRPRIEFLSDWNLFLYFPPGATDRGAAPGASRSTHLVTTEPRR